jgi:hypothetical protein
VQTSHSPANNERRIFMRRSNIRLAKSRASVDLIGQTETDSYQVRHYEGRGKYAQGTGILHRAPVPADSVHAGSRIPDCDSATRGAASVWREFSSFDR